MTRSPVLLLLACTGYGVRRLLERSIAAEKRFDAKVGNPDYKIGIAACLALRSAVARKRAHWLPMTELARILAVMRYLTESGELEEGEYNSGIGTIGSVRERLLCYMNGFDPGY